jgi:sortase A
MLLQDREQFRNTRAKQMLQRGRASVLLCLIFSFFLIGLYAYASNKDGTRITRKEIVEEKQSYSISRPIKLTIPSIEVNTKIEPVGFTKKYTMAVPDSYTNVGWYKYGVFPGQKGSAVIDGHLNNGFGLKAVFARLDELKPGDLIYVDNESGEKLRFKVESLEKYDYKEAPLELIFNESDKSYLKLITCNGSWIKNDKTYDTRLVVTAVLEEL